MLVVLNIVTHHFVYREEPEFPHGTGIKKAISCGLGPASDLLEIAITQDEWNVDLARQRQEEPPTHEDRISDLEHRLSALESDVH